MGELAAIELPGFHLRNIPGLIMIAWLVIQLHSSILPTVGFNCELVVEAAMQDALEGVNRDKETQLLISMTRRRYVD